MAVNITPRTILARELEKRTQRNPRYSLRQFAKSLGMSHTVLSLVLSGKRPLSKKATQIISEKLPLTPEEMTVLMNYRSKTVVNLQPQYSNVDLDTFNIVSNWIHYAILSLCEVENAVINPQWISRSLKISVEDAKDAMDRLINMGLIAEYEPGKWKQTGQSIAVENKISTAFTRRFHRELIDKALESLENDPIEVRNFSSMTMAIDPSHMGYAINRIRDFRRQLTAELEAKGAPKEVYNLTIQLYPVSSQGQL